MADTGTWQFSSSDNDLIIQKLLFTKDFGIYDFLKNYDTFGHKIIYKASQAIQSPRTVPFFLLVSLLDGYSFPNVLVKGIVAFKH